MENGKFKKVRAAIQEYNAKIAELENALDLAKTEQELLDEKALKAEILEDKGWGKNKEVAKIHRKKMEALKAEIEEKRRAVEILKEKQEKLRDEKQTSRLVIH